MRPLRVVLLVAGAFALVVVLAWGSTWKATAQNELTVWSSERDAAYATVKPEPTAQPVSRITRNAEVMVLWDTYGKDYWACYIKTPTNQLGWVLCTSLQRIA